MKLNFHPVRNGYHFNNAFVNHPFPAFPGFTTAGLCGGMSMSALDYWRSGIPIPTHTADDFAPAGSPPPNRVPPEGSRLRNNILRRQMDSLMVHSTYMRWLLTVPFRPDVFHSWAVGKEFDDARAQIDRGTPVLLGLWSMIPGNVFGHQVLCYGYDYDPIRLYVYDSNHPNEECELFPESPDQGCEIRILDNFQDRYQIKEHYRGYFVTDVYNWIEPAIVPPYHDLEIAAGLTLSPNGQDVPVSGPLECGVTIQNRGDYVAHFLSLYIWVRGPNGENLDTLLGGAEPNLVSLQPGEQHLITRRSEAFGAQTGDYVVGVSYLSAQGQWIGIPPGPSGTCTEQRVTLRPTTQLITDTTTTTRESDFEVDTGVVLQPGDEYALDAYGEIWGGVWGWTQNSPAGFTDRVEMNQQAPLYGVPQAHPFALLGRFENSSYFYVGQGIARQAFAQPTAQRLFLRINDAGPGNGTGAFQCHIRVWRLP